MYKLVPWLVFNILLAPASNTIAYSSIYYLLY
nr:MAG TPA_asm: hypothetical protein [Caudoviricetes sp.]